MLCKTERNNKNRKIRTSSKSLSKNKSVEEATVTLEEIVEGDSSSNDSEKATSKPKKNSPKKQSPKKVNSAASCDHERKSISTNEATKILKKKLSSVEKV